MKHLYTPEEARRWKARASRTKAFSIGALALALAVCILLCTRVTTANAQTLLLWAIALFTLAGWTAILLMYLVYAPARAQAVHIGGMVSAEAECAEGVLTLLKETFPIPKSITVRKATLQTAEGPVSLSVSAALARQLPVGVPLRVMTVRRFITAYEVIA